MKIAIVSKSNASGGGASRFAEDLAVMLILAGHEVHHYCARRHGKPRDFQRQLYTPCRSSSLIQTVNGLTRKLGAGEAVPLDYRLNFKPLFADYDIVHFHDHYSAYSLKGVELLAREMPVFFTAHDCLHFSGGCLYPRECTRYLTGCGSCPKKNDMGLFDLTRPVRTRNKRIANNAEFTYIYPSNWLKKTAEEALGNADCSVLLPYGFDSSVYDFKSRIEARKVLGLDADRKIILISAYNLANPVKGVDYAIKAVLDCADLNPLVLFVGTVGEELAGRLSDVSFLFSGFVNEKEKLGQYFAAADLFLFPTLQDNLPIAVQESMAAATPVVGFATGGVPDMVVNGETGWLVPTFDQEALNTALREALTSEETEQRGEKARQRLINHFSVGDCVEQHIALYEDKLASFNAK